MNNPGAGCRRRKSCRFCHEQACAELIEGTRDLPQKGTNLTKGEKRRDCFGVKQKTDWHQARIPTYSPPAACWDRPNREFISFCHPRGFPASNIRGQALPGIQPMLSSPNAVIGDPEAKVWVPAYNPREGQAVGLPVNREDIEAISYRH
jgi:hypothetical protein